MLKAFFPVPLCSFIPNFMKRNEGKRGGFCKCQEKGEKEMQRQRFKQARSAFLRA